MDYKRNLFFIPIVSGCIMVAGSFLAFFSKKYFIRYLPEVISLVMSFSIIALTVSLYRIIMISSIPFPSILPPLYLQLLPPFIAGFGLVFLLAPSFISYAIAKGIVTNPFMHAHPGMILKEPSARGGGFVFTIGFIIMSLLFVPVSKETAGIYIVVLLIALLGLADDYQNTHPRTFLKVLENPALRLFLLFIIVSLITNFGVRIDFLSNPFGGKIEFSEGGLLGSVVTVAWVVWIVWILNLLSWSNGIDGQYTGIIGISAIMLAILALRFSPLTHTDINYAKLALITAGCSLGLVRYTWHPSKIMWGFSAMSAGAVLAFLSVLINAKVAAAIVTIIIPFMDALVIFIRRILQKKNPMKGDRGHLHHLLLARGWSEKKIALFYWFTTAVFGSIGLISSEKYAIQVLLTISGLVAFFIILLNLKALPKKRGSPLPVK